MSDDARHTAPRTPLAIALQRSQDRGGFPRISAKGEGEIAATILRLAEEAGVPRHEDANLAATINQLPLQITLPPGVILALAEIYARLHVLGKLRRDIQANPSPNTGSKPS